jgi:hypothetical protein
VRRRVVREKVFQTIPTTDCAQLESPDELFSTANLLRSRGKPAGMSSWKHAVMYLLSCQSARAEHTDFRGRATLLSS